MGEGGCPGAGRANGMETTVTWGIIEWEGKSRQEWKWQFIKGKTQESFLTTGPLSSILQKLPWSLKIRMASSRSNR